MNIYGLADTYNCEIHDLVSRWWAWSQLRFPMAGLPQFANIAIKQGCSCWVMRFCALKNGMLQAQSCGK
jgi:hypothetical protein